MLIRMGRNWYWLLIIFGVVLGGAFLIRQTLPTGNPVTINGITVPPVPALHIQLVSEGETLYAQHCASCHGANLEGVPEWKTVQPDGKLLPPPHDSSGHTWHHPDDLLLSIIAEGGEPSNSDMPAYADILTDEEAIAILTTIKNSWGPEEREFQWWITAKGQ
jgi:mono/diheme cytochrome c family protein